MRPFRKSYCVAADVFEVLDGKVEVADGARRFGSLTGLETREESHYQLGLNLSRLAVEGICFRHSQIPKTFQGDR